MTNFDHGMDVARVRTLADDLDKAKKDLHEAVQKADAAVKKMGSNWAGADETEFQQTWTKSHTNINHQIEDIGKMAKTCRQEAQQQQQTSKA